jgi:Mn-containing catalase
MKAFIQALDSLGKSTLSDGKLIPGKGALSVGLIDPTPGIVSQYYNDSTGEGDQGEVDTTGPWNSDPDITVVESPALSGFQATKASPRSGKTTLDEAKNGRVV